MNQIVDDAVKVKGITLRGLRSKAEQKVKVFFLHGFLDNANIFKPWLQQSDLPSASYDLAGHALSDFLSIDHYYYNWMNECFRYCELINTTGDNEVILVGHSLGAAFASTIASLMGDKIKKIILLDNISFLTAKEDDLYQRVLSNYLKGLKDSQNRIYRTFDAAVKMRETDDVFNETLNLLAERGVSKIENKGYVWVFDRRLKLPTPQRLTENQVLSLLKQIKAKTHIILSEKSLAFHKSFHFELKMKSILNHKLTIIPSGHHYKAFDFSWNQLVNV
jgi:pimeloyl-ACP methyl ester carboxylesterase